jgi:hypothetical protein
MNVRTQLSRLKRVLATVLAVGNYVNGGTSRGQAYGTGFTACTLLPVWLLFVSTRLLCIAMLMLYTGFKLDTLMKLQNVKASTSKRTLLNFVASEVRRLHADDLTFYRQAYVRAWAYDSAYSCYKLAFKHECNRCRKHTIAFKLVYSNWSNIRSAGGLSYAQIETELRQTLNDVSKIETEVSDR